MKAMWSGSLSFGLINIPVKVYLASQENAVHFSMLHDKDFSPIRFARICKEDGEEVPYSHIVKGYEYEKGHFIVLSEEELKSANLKKSSNIEIQYFTDIDEISPQYFEKPYFIEPDKKAGKAYQLLNAALKKSNKTAVVKFVFQHKEHLGAIFPYKGILMLLQMRFHNEIRSFEDLNIPDDSVSDKELKMALSLVEHLSGKFEPEKQQDTYTEEILKMIDKKLKGKKISAQTKKSAPIYKIEDLMGLLQASLKDKPSKRKEAPVPLKQKKAR
jgi:DNA end-binding protein Ku